METRFRQPQLERPEPPFRAVTPPDSTTKRGER